MARATAKNGLPLPRSLADVRAIRREAVALYRQAKGGQVEAQLAGRLAHLLQLLTSITRDHQLEERIVELERHVAAKPNGADRHAAY